MSVPGIGATVADKMFKSDNVKQKKQKIILLGAPDLQLIFNQLLFKDGF
jgi:hypothetical protein